jgi:hypothetical protein
MGLVGEITETVGGLNRNARTLSPKYALAVCATAGADGEEDDDGHQAQRIAALKEGT